MANISYNTSQDFQYLIKTEAFYPDFDVAKFRIDYSIEDSIAQDSVITDATLAVLKVCDELQEFKIQSLKTQLAETSTDLINTQNRNELLFFEAISCFTKVNLIQRFFALNLVEVGEKHAELQLKIKGDYVARGFEAISQIKKQKSNASIVLL